MSTRVSVSGRSLFSSFIRKSPVVLLFAAGPVFAQTQVFTPGNLVVLVEGCGQVNGTASSCAIPNGTGTATLNATAGGYGDNQAAPITLFQFAPNGTSSAAYVSSFVLPQAASGVADLPVTGEYGSSSEGTLQLSGDGKYLTFAGYGIPAATYNASPNSYGSVAALAQSTSLSNSTKYTPVARVVALVDAYGTVKSSTALFNIFDTNNPRSVYSPDGQRAWLSGQGSGSDATGGVFFTTLGATNNSPTAITGLDATNNTVSQDTRTVQIYNGQLYVSVDSKGGSGSARSYVGTVGTGTPTTTAGAPNMLNNFGTTAQNGKVTITSGANSNGNGPNAGLQINVSPSNFFFASPSVLYVADTGNGKQTSANSSLGNGGLEKWVNTAADGSGTWNLAYTLHNGLTLVANAANGGTTGSTGLYGLAGKVVGSSVLLYATDNVLSDLDLTHLYGVTDTLTYTTATQASGETFSLLATAPKDSNFKGVAFAPTPAPGAVGLNVESTQVDPSSQYVSLTAAGTFSGGSGYPSAPITVQVGSGPVIPASCSVYSATGLCVVNYPVASIASGQNTVTVKYAGDSNYQPLTGTGTVNKTGTQNYVGLAVSGVSSTTGAATVQLSVTASWPAGPAPQNAGAATFQVDGGVKVGASCSLNPTNLSSATCTADYPTSGLGAGYHSINVVVPSDGYFQQSVGSSTLFLK